jgi:hypothetical protein
MTRTTPPRPLDIRRHFPELHGHSAMATRLHPRPGAPTVADSSVGGPLLWPIDEPWPVCTDGDAHHISRLRRPASVRRARAIYAAARARAAIGESYHLTDEEQAQLLRFDFSEPNDLVNQPIPLVAVAQLYRRDVPDFAGPDGTDLLQMLWCPLDHPAEECNPRVRLRWRRSAEVGVRLDAAPEPPVVNANYLPTPCVVHPEQVREYQYIGALPKELDDRVTAWEEAWEQETGRSYQGDLSLAPGWKVAGFASWALTDPYPMNCAECGAAMTPLLAAGSVEWDPTGSWRPVEDPADGANDPTDVTIGRGYTLFVFRCPESFDHPPASTMQ